MDELTLATLCADRDHLLKELDAYALRERSIHPSEAGIASLRGRLALLDKLIPRQLRLRS